MCLSANSHDSIEQAVSQLLDETLPSKRPAMLTRLLKEFEPAQIASSIYSHAQKDPIPALTSIRGSSALQPVAHEVDVVAIHYMRIGIGGAEDVVVRLCNLWVSMGLRVVLLTDEGKSEQEPPDGVTWIELPPQQDRYADSYLERAQALQHALVDNHVDVFVNNQWTSQLAPWDLLTAKLCGVATIVHTHGAYTELATSIFDGHKVLPVAYSLADGIVCLSDCDEAFWRLSNSRVYRTINLPRYSCKCEEVSRLKGAELLWVGRLSHEDKHPERALEMMPKVVGRHPEAHLTIVGSGDARYEEELISIASNLGISDHVTFAGAHRNLRPFYQRAAIHIVTSSTEGYSLVIAESKVFGVPCVMYDIPTLQFLQQPQGLISVPQDNSDLMAATICSILENESLRNKLGREARMQEELLEEFDAASFWRRVFRNAILDYESVPKTDSIPQKMWDSLWEGEYKRDNAEYAVHWQEHLETEAAKKRARDAEAALLTQRDSKSPKQPEGYSLRNAIKRLVRH